VAFAVTPYGDWHARELEVFVRDLGFTPAEALRSASQVASSFLAHGDKLGVLSPGRHADFIAVEGSPIDNIALLQDEKRIRHVHIGGKRLQIPERGYDPNLVTDKFWIKRGRPLYLGAGV
jgi:imidazolonepropionase-like amidohydrolase